MPHAITYLSTAEHFRYSRGNMSTREKSSFVIGISSVSGGGKTAVAKKLTELLQDAVMLCFDDYDDTTIHSEDLHAWLAAGADYNVWKTPALTRDLQSLTTGNQITSPADGSTIQGAKYVVFDAPLGRAHADTGRFIDLMYSLILRWTSRWPADSCVTSAAIPERTLKIPSKVSRRTSFLI